MINKVYIDKVLGVKVQARVVILITKPDSTVIALACKLTTLTDLEWL